MDNEDRDINKEDKLWKVRPLLDNCAKNFQKYVEPEQINAVDEMLVPFKVKIDVLYLHVLSFSFFSIFKLESLIKDISFCVSGFTSRMIINIDLSIFLFRERAHYEYTWSRNLKSSASSSGVWLVKLDTSTNFMLQVYKVTILCHVMKIIYISWI